MTEFILRAPQETDIEALAALHFYMWNEFYKDYVPRAYSEKWYTKHQCVAIQNNMIAACRDKPSDNFARVAEIDGKIAAIGYINRAEGNSDDLVIPGFDTEFQRLYLWPEYRGKNLGSIMMTKGMEWLKHHNYRSTYLWAFDKNPYGRFYDKHGATIVKQMERDYEGVPLALTAYGWRL